MILQHSFHNEIRSNEDVPVHTLTRLAVKRRHRYGLIHEGHMAFLTGLRRRIVAMLPLLERHLLREPCHLLAVRSKRRRDQRMAAPTQASIANVVAPRWEV